MLTSETKRHIDAARQVLVGVVPNPSSQIDQITNALIYKFMDDMDQMAIKAGGKASFFIGDLGKYAWTRLMDTRLGNQERMNLYSEALTKFGEAKQLPELFRDIFKRAFLPYRSPEVLGLFLKEIAYFDYVHSEELGNAYEYLLSIMGSQGDAGQFRTPRHIIDFIVEIVNPQKSDRILDPACGTAGFLISAYKHILTKHDGKNTDGTKNDEKPLTASDKVKLTQNFEGYEIDPGMARISQVNMYLHQFRNPKIYNYDTLSQEERWNEKYDIILANPPFMSPRGGIKPHGRFSINAGRSEILFLDYIMDHIRPKGRAGVIVPDTVLYLPSKPYKQLRKKMSDGYLTTIISLPKEAFNPYAKLSTSILIFEPSIAKVSKEIILCKISNDGFGGGAQRRKIQENDLPEAKKQLELALSELRVHGEISTRSSLIGSLRKDEIDASTNRLLPNSGENDNDKSLLPNRKQFGEIFEISGKEKAGIQKLPILSVTMHQGLVEQSSRFKQRMASSNTHTYKVVRRNELVVGFPIDEGVMGFQDLHDKAIVSPAYDVWRLINPKEVHIPFLQMILRSKEARKMYAENMQGAIGRRRSVPKPLLKKLYIPLPPLEEQKKVSNNVKDIGIEIEKLSLQIEERKQQAENIVSTLWSE